MKPSIYEFILALLFIYFCSWLVIFFVKPYQIVSFFCSFDIFFLTLVCGLISKKEKKKSKLEPGNSAWESEN